MACSKGIAQQCQLLCASGRKYLDCANQQGRINGRDWIVQSWTSGYGPDGLYLAHLNIRCALPLSGPASPLAQAEQHAIDYDGEQFRGPVSKRMHPTMGEAVREVCAAAPVPAPSRKPDYSPLFPTSDERPRDAGNVPAATSVHKCRAADGTIVLTDAACPKASE